MSSPVDRCWGVRLPSCDLCRLLLDTTMGSTLSSNRDQVPDPVPGLGQASQTTAYAASASHNATRSCGSTYCREVYRGLYRKSRSISYHDTPHDIPSDTRIFYDMITNCTEYDNKLYHTPPGEFCGPKQADFYIFFSLPAVNCVHINKRTRCRSVTNVTRCEPIR